MANNIRVKTGEKAEKVPIWKSRQGSIPMDQLAEEHLRKAYTHCQVKELHHHNFCSKFSLLGEELLQEAERRGITLLELDDLKKMGDYFNNKRVLNKHQIA